MIPPCPRCGKAFQRKPDRARHVTKCTLDPALMLAVLDLNITRYRAQARQELGAQGERMADYAALLEAVRAQMHEIGKKA